MARGATVLIREILGNTDRTRQIELISSEIIIMITIIILNPGIAGDGFWWGHALVPATGAAPSCRQGNHCLWENKIICSNLSIYCGRRQSTIISRPWGQSATTFPGSHRMVPAHVFDLICTSDEDSIKNIIAATNNCRDHDCEGEKCKAAATKLMPYKRKVQSVQRSAAILKAHENRESSHRKKIWSSIINSEWQDDDCVTTIILHRKSIFTIWLESLWKAQSECL